MGRWMDVWIYQKGTALGIFCRKAWKWNEAQRWNLCYEHLVTGTVQNKGERKKQTEGAAVWFLAVWSCPWWIIIQEALSETEFLSGGKQAIVSRGRMVMFGFVIEIISVKVKKEKRNKERIKLFEIKRTWTGSILWTAHLSNPFSLCITGASHGSH